MKNYNPLISIIVPVYNVKAYISRCLDSILKQTYKNLEIILIDDGSTDTSGKICDNYAEKDSRIIVIHKKNGGLSDARNAGIRKATGTFIAFVDSDDYIKNDMIEYLVADSSEADTVICSHYVEQRGKLHNFNTDSKRTNLKPEEALRLMLLEKGFMVSAWGKLFRRDLFDGVSFPKGKLHEDLGTTYLLLMKSNTVLFLPEPKYYYIQRKNSIAHKKFNSGKFDIIALTDKMCDDIDKKYPGLKDVTDIRRMRARFSILRQIPTNDPRIKMIKTYLRKNKDKILKNKEAGKKEKIALRIALLNTKIFQLSYKIAH